ncbi:MAG TPA: hypothetical protein VH023_04940 [Rhodopila sp.]|nr:hypothetical protein [Rhodopila sp.]
MHHWVAWLHVAGWNRDLDGYVASALVLATFSMKSMRALRLLAIASNVAFILYALVADLHPILVLHATLLPLNIVRLAQAELTAANRRTPHPDGFASTVATAGFRNE